MITEFEVRRRVRDITSSSETPRQKARRLLSLGRVLKAQVRALERARSMSNGEDPNATALFSRIARVAQGLRDELREEAQRIATPRAGDSELNGAGQPAEQAAGNRVGLY